MAEAEEKIKDYISGQLVKSTPEEVEAVQPFSKILVEDYGYPKEYIQTRPQWRVKVRPSDVKKEYPVDIAIFSEPNHSDDTYISLLSAKRRIEKTAKLNFKTTCDCRKPALAFGSTAVKKCIFEKSSMTGKSSLRRYPIFLYLGRGLKISENFVVKTYVQPKI